VPEIVGAFGFGSFFRSDDAADCDLLLVLDDMSTERGRLHAQLSAVFRKLSQELGIEFDVTILTESEHRNLPLLEHARLVALLPYSG
jgi:hypothetical protein